MTIASCNSTKTTFRRSMDSKHPTMRLTEPIKPEDFKSKLKQYHLLVKKVMKLHNIQKSIPTTYQKPCKAVIKSVNNPKVVKLALKRRWWWSITENI
jgi:hypothetical protein